MRAIRETGHGGPEVLTVTDAPQPTAGEGQVLLRVAASGINRADVMQRRGFYPPPPGESDIYGLEVSGTVVDVGPGAPGELLGQERVALLASGGYAEYVAVNYQHTLPTPKGVSLVEAAGLMEVAATVYSNLVRVCGISENTAENAGCTLMIHGGTGGIGSHAIQLGQTLGLRVLATAGSDTKCERIKQLGAEPINYRTQNFREAVRELTGGKGTDVILDVVGGSYLGDNLKTLAVEGSLVIIGLQGGREANIDLGFMLTRRLSVHATSLRTRSSADKAAIVAGVRRVTWPLIESGAISPHLDRTFPLDRAADAHSYFDSGVHAGKILLVP